MSDPTSPYDPNPPDTPANVPVGEDNAVFMRELDPNDPLDRIIHIEQHLHSRLGFRTLAQLGADRARAAEERQTDDG